jgi:hypothetical protein
MHRSSGAEDRLVAGSCASKTTGGQGFGIVVYQPQLGPVPSDLPGAAVNEHLVTGHEAGVVGGEEGDGLGEFLGAA